MLNRPRVYLASPLFSGTERRRNEELRDKLASFSEVYLPQEDGQLLVELVRDGMPPEKAKRMIFDHNIVAINRCDVLVIIMDGRIVDEGACVELGYAYSRGKICVGLKSDVRSLLPVGDNPMIECSLHCIFHDDDDLVEWISEAKWKPS